MRGKVNDHADHEQRNQDRAQTDEAVAFLRLNQVILAVTDFSGVKQKWKSKLEFEMYSPAS